MKDKVFRYWSPYSLPKIKPSMSFIPKWYKDIKGYNNKNIKFDSRLEVMRGVKNCLPFFDSFSSGYMIELWADIYISQENGYVQIIWGNAFPDVAFTRATEENNIPVPAGHNPSHFVWQFPYTIKLPKGYSFLLTHPLNRYDLPFTTLTGVVDADSLMVNGNLPFFIKEGFEGVLEAGTPICQIIPFKRESWNSKECGKLELENKNFTARRDRKFFNFYKNNGWVKKDYK